jgi:ankyrin repeat protein
MKSPLAIVATALLFAFQPAAAGVFEDILFAAEQGKTDEVVDLLRRGMDVNTTDPQGSTLLMIATRTRNVELTRFLLDNRANPLKRNRYGDTALMIAALQGYGEIVDMFLNRKVEPNHAGWTALHYAAFNGHPEIIAKLLAAGADANLRAPNGWTALMLAARNGNLEAVRILVGYGADHSVADPEFGTALEIARKGNHADIASFLEKAGAR